MSLIDQQRERDGQLSLIRPQTAEKAQDSVHLSIPRKVPLYTRLVPLDAWVGDVTGNAAKMAAEMAQAERDGVELLVFPELALSGYPPEDLLYRQDFLDTCKTELSRLVELSGGTATIIGHPEQDADGRLYNALIVARNREVIGSYRKQHLPNYGVFDEQRYFTSGHGVSVIDIDGQRVGLTICEDIWADGNPISGMKAHGADLVVNISASPYHRGKGGERIKLLADRAAEAGCPIAYCNILGGQDELVFDGHCAVVTAAGEVVAELPPFVADATGDAHLNWSEHHPEHQPALDETAEVYAALVMSVKDYVTKSGFSGVTLGLSGGVDSALVFTVAVDALGAENVHPVVMPSEYSSEGTQGDARELATAAGADLHELPIAPMLDGYLEALSQEFAGLEQDVTEENIQARIRGTLLMALSNKFGWLVLACSNRSESSVGYFTVSGGDSTGGFSPIKDVPKLLVYQLIKWRADRGDLRVPIDIITREPSAELKPDQVDSDSLPPYEILDPILEAYLEKNMDAADIVAAGFDPAVVKRILRLVQIAEYKRRQAPPGPKITIKAFGRDRRMPIANQFISWSSLDQDTRS